MAKIKKPQRQGAFAKARMNIEENAKKAELVVLEKRNNNDIQKIIIDNIQNPKTHDRVGYSETAIYELSKNMIEVGQLQAIVVRELKDGSLERIIGYRRILAAKRAGWETIDAIVLKDISDSVAALMMLSENMHREDPNLYDQTVKLIEYVSVSLNIQNTELISFLHRLRNFDANNIIELDADEKSMRQEIIDILTKTAKISITTLVDRLRILRIDKKLIMAMRENKLQYSQAIELDKIKNNKNFEDIISIVIQNNMTYKEVKELVNGYKKKPLTTNNTIESSIINYKKRISSSKIKKLDDSKQQLIEKYFQEIVKILDSEK